MASTSAPSSPDRDVESQGQHDEKLASASAASPVQGGLRPYGHGFWDKELAPMRKAYLIGIARITVAITVLIWAVVTIYWGSLWKSTEKSPNIGAYVVNRDANGAIGTNITNALLATNNGPLPHLTWTSIAPSQLPDEAAIENSIAVEENAWVLVDIMQDATAALDSARSSGNGRWDPTQVVRVYYSEARSQQAVDGVILGAVRGTLTPLLAKIGVTSTAQWLSGNTGNAAALTTIAQQAPQTLANPVALQYINLRPWDEPVSIAPTFVGLIYAMILAFNITMGNFGMRQGIQRKLRLRSFILMRLLVPIASYFVLSCMFTLINVPFKLGLGGLGLGYGAGFMIWWCFTFLGMTVLGLWTEAALSLVGPQFIGFALVFIIIINVSVSNLPIALQVSLFKYGYAMPFYNLRLAYIAIIYNTGRHVDLVKYMGILLAWLVVLFMTLPVWIWVERRKERKAAAASGPAGPPGPPAAAQPSKESDDTHHHLVDDHRA